MKRGVFALIVVAAAGCGTFGNNRDDLQQASALHHIDLRWGRLENAAQRVAPEMRGAFLQAWAARLHTMELQDIEVSGMVLNEAGDGADVIVTVTWVDRATMSVKTSVLPEKWKKIDGTWMCSEPAEPPSLDEG